MSVRVVARIRPLLDNELDKDTIVRADGVEAGKPTIVKVPNPRNEGEEFSFAFNGVYDQQASQETLFTAEVAPYLKSLFQGLDVTIFAYGVTGTGKTHTMRGGLKLAERGVIPRLLSGVFRRGKKITKDSEGNTTVQVALSYYEIYNDKVYDLLEPPEKRTATGLPLRAEASGRTVVVGLSERACVDLKDFEKMYIEANNNRVTASTKLNAHSSRSHAILRVKLTQTTGDTVRESTASAIDLAGSEDNRRTENGKERLVESAAINKSLFVLSQCIDAISRGDKRVPYRESKMTRILSLGQNNGATVMILNLAPLRSYHLDTLSSLNVSSRAKRIEVREIENEVVFKQVPRANSGGGGGLGVQRQPLRPLANAHNVHNGNIAAKAADANRPVKAFSVYTDKSKPASATRPTANAGQMRQPTSQKRPSDHEPVSRPSKVARPIDQASVTVSAAQIEAMVERKVNEILAARTVAETSASQAQLSPVQIQPDISSAVQKRLEALERRIESDDWRDDAKSDGLRFLLAARQHRERGDAAATLEAYEAALPYFPGQAKLLGKIERLRAKIEGAAGESGRGSERSPEVRSARKRQRRQKKMLEEGGEVKDGEADVDEEFAEGASPRRKHRKQKAEAVLSDTIVNMTNANTKPDTDIHTDTNTDAINTSIDAITSSAPQTQQLLAVVNSRDLVQIRSLVGFGAKKARDLVDYLDAATVEAAMGEQQQQRQIESLDELRALPGMEGRVVERAWEGLAV